MVLIASPRGEEMESEQKKSVEDTPVEGEKRLPTPSLLGGVTRGASIKAPSPGPLLSRVSCLEYHWLWVNLPRNPGERYPKRELLPGLSLKMGWRVGIRLSSDREQLEGRN